MYPGRFKTMVFDHTRVDLDAIRSAGEAEIVLRARCAFTDRNWQRRVLGLEKRYTVPVIVEE
jgi:hypothetical protein